MTLSNPTIYLTFIAALIPTVSLFGIESTHIGLILGSLYLFWCVRLLLLSKNPSYPNSVKATILLLGILISGGYALFYAIGLTKPALAVFLGLLPILFLLKKRTPRGKEKKQIKTPTSGLNLLFTLAHLALVIVCFVLLFQSGTLEALRSPWEVVPKEFFIIYFLTTVALVVPLFNKNKKVLVTGYWLPVTMFQISLHTLLTSSVALIIYGVGFGFDPFIHQATENILIETGTISPTPFLYIGQYSLVTILHHLTHTPHTLIDKLLVPVLGSLLLPPIIMHSVRTRHAWPLPATLTPLLIPLSLLIVTVPQNLANIFLIILIFYGYSVADKPHKHQLATIWGLALTTLFIHPLSGIPAGIFAFLYTARAFPERKNLTTPLIALSSLAIPLFFYLASLLSPELTITFGYQNIFSLIHLQIFSWLPFNSLTHHLYFYASCTTLLFVVLALVGIKQTKTKLSPSLLTLYLLVINLFFTSFLTFSSLPLSEQDEFANRLWIVALLFLLPYVAHGILHTMQAAQKLPLPALFTPALLSLIITANLYLAYPRVDQITPKARGFSTSSYDLEAVRWIEQDAGGDDYIVLANQSVSAAALQELGFKQYYQKPLEPELVEGPSSRSTPSGTKTESIFFYPIPTGGELYKKYLDMVYVAPSAQTARGAMQLAGVNKAYFVLNDYWLDAEKIKTAASLEANSSHTIGDNKVYIFSYSK